jgi:hypothetical protein
MTDSTLARPSILTREVLRTGGTLKDAPSAPNLIDAHWCFVLQGVRCFQFRTYPKSEKRRYRVPPRADGNCYESAARHRRIFESYSSPAPKIEPRAQCHVLHQILLFGACDDCAFTRTCTL